MAQDSAYQLRISTAKLAGERVLPLPVSAWLSVHKELKPAIADLVAGRPARLKTAKDDRLYLFFCLDDKPENPEKQPGPRRIMRVRLRFESRAAETAGKPGAGSKKAKLDAAAAGALLFARDTRGLADSVTQAVTGATGRKINETELLLRVRRQIKAGKWKKDNCSNCPYRYLNEGKIKSIGEMLTDKRVKKPKDTCKNCPSRPLLAAISK